MTLVRRVTLLTGVALLLSMLHLVPMGSASAAVPAVSTTSAPARSVSADPNARRGWKPAWGAAFNNPVGSPAARNALMRRIKNAITHAKKGSTIRIAEYSNDRVDFANALIKAHRRGVDVKVLLNDNWTSAATTKLKRALGSKRKKRSWVYVCDRSCGGGPGNLHMKVFSFDRTGAARNVIMTGSTNTTNRAVNLQYNDLYTLADPGLFRTWTRVFAKLKNDKNRPRWIYYTGKNTSATFYRELSEVTGRSFRSPQSATTTTAARLPTKAEDPVMKRLNQVSCAAPRGTGNARGRTKVRITMYAWANKRGVWLAEKVAQLKRRGCDVAVILSVPGGQVVKILRESGVPMRSADWAYIPNSANPSGYTVDFYSHLKVLTIDGGFRGKGQQVVWTGSENWSMMSFRNDELILELHGAGPYRRYDRQFSTMWSGRATHAMGVKPVGKP
ncbi:phospholipase D-like domain-containing protein [Nocardioides insulae]|uniref:phospholipase D-like domain-containing protein n=1 Tax=Nocardioides insulae TaxID=394734 RepID=UPI0004042D47|nr:phospholipase D-like domain-containing protein [Nocardioides insulae]